MAALTLRRNDVDWLRVFAVYLLFLFHTAMVFNPAPFYHIRNADLSFVMLIVAGFISLWHMPLFFLLAGWSAYGSLAARGTGGFVKERILKLWVPLVMGSVLLMPPIKYVELLSGLDANYAGLRVSPALQPGFKQIIPTGLPTMPPFNESFLEFLPTFFTHLERYTWAHLWFIAYLLVFTLLYLPLFRWLQGRRGELAHAPAWAIYLPIVPLALVQIFLRPYWPGLQNLYDDWANVGYYSTYLIAGLLLARYPALERAVHREWKRALGIALAATGVLLLGVLRVYDAPSVLLAGSAIAGWCFVVALLGAAHRFLVSVTTGLPYLVESAFPVYWLHQSAIVLIGYLVIRLELGIAAKFALLLAASVSATLVVYHFGIRPFVLARFWVGMKPRPKQRAISALPRRAAAALIIGLATVSLARTAGAASPVGVWYAEGGAARVEIDICAAVLCGRVVWLRSPFDENGCDQHDAHNPDPALRDRPIMGLEVLTGLQSSSDGELWSGGTIYDPTSGRTYRCTARLEGPDRLHIRGFIGVPLLGRTTTWIRVGSENQMCKR
jgi:uncharacterized protein (DUF2147 family)